VDQSGSGAADTVDRAERIINRGLSSRRCGSSVGILNWDTKNVDNQKGGDHHTGIHSSSHFSDKQFKKWQVQSNSFSSGTN